VASGTKLKPEYNILEQAGSSLGYKHTAATLEFFKKERKVNEAPFGDLRQLC